MNDTMKAAINAAVQFLASGEQTEYRANVDIVACKLMNGLMKVIEAQQAEIERLKAEIVTDDDKVSVMSEGYSFPPKFCDTIWFCSHCESHVVPDRSEDDQPICPVCGYVMHE